MLTRSCVGTFHMTKISLNTNFNLVCQRYNIIYYYTFTSYFVQSYS